MVICSILFHSILRCSVKTRITQFDPWGCSAPFIPAAEAPQIAWPSSLASPRWGKWSDPHAAPWEEIEATQQRFFFSKERLRHLLLHVGSVGTIFLVTVIMIPKWDGIWKTWNDQQPLRPLLPSFSSEPRENQEIAFPKWSPKKEQLA